MSEQKIEKVVYFVRHGQSEDNIAPVFPAPGSPLNEKGIKQVECIAERVSRLSFDMLVASPFERAKQTAEVIARQIGKKAEYSDLFVEHIKPTYINGRSRSEDKASIIWEEWAKSLYTPGMRVEDGENFDDLLMRADKALAFLQHRAEKSIVVITHGYFMRAIIARVLLGDLLSGEAFRRFQITTSTEYTGLTVLRYHCGPEKKPFWRLWIYNDHAHLG